MRKTRLDNVPISEARERLLAAASLVPDVEEVSVTRSTGWMTAEPVFARFSMPAYPAAAMDGIAVKAVLTERASSESPILLMEGRDFDYINTGDPLPANRDAVIMIEHVREREEGLAEVRTAIPPWKHVRQAGEDVAAGEMIIPARHRIRPVDIGAMLAGGRTQVKVLKKPRGAIIPTGSEMVTPGTLPKRGQIIEFNGAVFASYLEEWGAEAVNRGIVPDDPEAIRQAVLDSVADCDFVILNAGSSAGTRDYTYQVLSELGDVLLHGVAARPGKPVVLAVVKGKPVLGLPGYPVSAYHSLDWFARPLIQTWYGEREGEGRRLTVRLSRSISGKLGAEDFIRLGVIYKEGEFWAFPLQRGAGVTMSLVKADALLRIPSQESGWEAGERVEVEGLRSPSEIARTLWLAGEDDPLLDRLASLFQQQHPGWSLRRLSGNGDNRSGGDWHGLVGVADRMRETFDPAGGVFFRLVEREWGWLTMPENRGRIFGGKGIPKADLGLIRPAAGSGLDDGLDRKYREAEELLEGRLRREPTLLKAAAAVASGTADVAVGTRTAAHPFGLSFIPAGILPLDLWLPNATLKTEGGGRLLSTLRSRAFQQAAEELPGYSTRSTGEKLEQSNEGVVSWDNQNQ
ncbi:molybdopterin-binding protein [Salinithrix halophila]|uniref:Molybdopterin molybdenumtransferase n=1 Tax=Salinithrix halophila TaxID=1485204 RepID=A0ABV8JC20_9BACL